MSEICRNRDLSRPPSSAPYGLVSNGDVQVAPVAPFVCTPMGVSQVVFTCCFGLGHVNVEFVVVMRCLVSRGAATYSTVSVTASTPLG